METEIDKTLPKTAFGTVHAQFVRCGKANCRCARGVLHGAYFYHFVRINGRLRKRYVRPDMLAEIQAVCLAGKNRQDLQSKRTADDWDVFRSVREKVRAFEGISGSGAQE